MATKKTTKKAAKAKAPAKKVNVKAGAVKQRVNLAASAKNPKNVPVIKTTASGQKFVDRVVDQLAKG